MKRKKQEKRANLDKLSVQRSVDKLLFMVLHTWLVRNHPQKFRQIEIELVLIRVLRVGFSGISTTRLIVGVISAMVEKELGERNFGFDSLKLNMRL